MQYLQESERERETLMLVPRVVKAEVLTFLLIGKARLARLYQESMKVSK